VKATDDNIAFKRILSIQLDTKSSDLQWFSPAVQL